MTRLFRTSVILWLLCVGAPSPASASIMDWLDRLSGPGPFWGVDLDMQVNCPSRKEGSPPSGVKALASAIVISCPNESFHTQHFNWYLTTGLGFATSGKNKLNYGEASNTSTKAIGTFKVGTAVDYTASRAFDLGVGAGVMYFYGPRFDNFARPYFQPLRLAIRPLLLKDIPRSRQTSNDPNGWLIVNLNVMVLLGTIDGSTFGAPADPWHVHNEFVPEIGVGLDVVKLLKKL